MKTTKEIVTGNWKPNQLNQEWFSKEEVKKIISKVIWRISVDEGGQILHYNDWVNDNLKILMKGGLPNGKTNKVKNC